MLGKQRTAIKLLAKKSLWANRAKKLYTLSWAEIGLALLSVSLPYVGLQPIGRCPLVQSNHNRSSRINGP
jgi:hypothetical protein